MQRPKLPIQGWQYVLIRFSITASTFVPLLGLTSYFYQNRDVPLQEIFSGLRLPLLNSLALLSIVALRFRCALFDAIDHRFLRSRFDPRTLEDKIQRPPGLYLRALAECLFSSRIFSLVLEPTLRDLYDDYCEALKAGRLRKAGWVRIRGYWSFWSAVLAQLPVSAVKVVYKIWKATR
jgi:hypothetical protein